MRVNIYNTETRKFVRRFFLSKNVLWRIGRKLKMSAWKVAAKLERGERVVTGLHAFERLEGRYALSGRRKHWVNYAAEMRAKRCDSGREKKGGLEPENKRPRGRRASRSSLTRNL